MVRLNLNDAETNAIPTKEAIRQQTWSQKKKPLVAQGVFLGVFCGADDGARTRNIQLGKLTLCQLNYIRTSVVLVYMTLHTGCN